MCAYVSVSVLGGGVYCCHIVCLYVRPFVKFCFLLIILLNNLRNLFIFCINICIDELLLLDKNKDLGFNSIRVICLCNS